MFRKRKPVKQLSAEELKSKLYEHFDKTGTLNKMRTELRGKLVTELFKITAPLETSNLDNPDIPNTNFDKTLLPLQVCNWLVYDHLLRQGYQYALSTFVTEANLPHPEELLTACDILGLFGLDNSTPEYKSISQMYSTSNERGFLHSLLLAVIKSLFDFSTRDDNIKQNVVGKDVAGITVEETSQDIPFFNRIDKAENRKVQEYPDSFSRPRNKSADSSVHEQLQSMKEEKDREIQALRQKLMQEVDRLHSQECKMRHEIESERRELKRELQAIDVEKEKFQERELLLTKEHDNKLEKKMRELEVDFVSKLHAKEKLLENAQGKLYDKEVRLSQVEADFASMQGSYNSLRKEFEEVRQTYSSLLDENTNLLRKFESMSDYSSLKGDLETSSKEISGLRRELDDVRKHAEKEKESLLDKVRSLEAKLKVKEPQLLEAQRQLNVTKDTLHMEEAEWHREKRRLEQESQASKELYKTLIQRIEEQRNDIQALHHTIHILHYQLTDTDKRNQTKIEAFVPYRAATKITGASRSEPEIFRINNNSKISTSKYEESLKFIEEAKERINKLQKESNAWQEKSSMIYCSLPGIEDFANYHATSTFNTTSRPVRTFQTQPYNNQFENLIRNEMPTLDLNMPAHLKSRLANSFSNIYSPKSTSLSTPTTSVKYSSSSMHQKLSAPDVEFSGNITKPSSISALTTQQTNIIGNTVNSEHPNALNKFSAQNRNDRFIPLNAQPSIGKVPDSNSSAFGISTIERLGLFQDQQTKQPENIIKSFSAEQTESAFISTDVKKENELNLQNCKPSAEGSKLESSSVIQSETQRKVITPGTETVQLNAGTDSSVSPFKGGSGNNISTSIVVDLDAAWKRKASLKDNSEPEPVPPILVDLDSAWKRKTSLKEVADPVPPILASLDSAWKRKTSLMSSMHSVPQGGLVTNPHIDKNLNDENTNSDRTTTKNELGAEERKRKEFPEISSNIPLSTKPNNEKVEPIIKQAGNVEPSQDLQPESKHCETKPQSSKDIEEISEDNETYNDPVVKKDTANASKPIPEDSLSELSEIHLSCGSEQEHQKDDSDNW